MISTRVINIKLTREPHVYVGRGQGSIFGNPYVVGRLCGRCGQMHYSRGETLPCYAAYLDERMRTEPAFRAAVLALRGRVLGCSCRPKEGFRRRVSCHAQLLAALIENCRPEEIE